MNRRILVIFLLFSIWLLAAASCEHTSDPSPSCTETLISQPNAMASHNHGTQCVSCHTLGEAGPGCFTLAGSVYQPNKTDPYTAGEVRLYTQLNAQGELRGTFYIDGKGNFYTTAKIEWGPSLYATIYDANGNPKHMQDAVNDGNCNHCHSAMDDRLTLP